MLSVTNFHTECMAHFQKSGYIYVLVGKNFKYFAEFRFLAVLHGEKYGDKIFRKFEFSDFLGTKSEINQLVNFEIGKMI